MLPSTRTGNSLGKMSYSIPRVGELALRLFSLEDIDNTNKSCPALDDFTINIFYLKFLQTFPVIPTGLKAKPLTRDGRQEG